MIPNTRVLAAFDKPSLSIGQLIGEPVDNSQAANARHIDILTKNPDAHQGGFIEITDDGDSCTAKIADEAMRLGSNTPKNGFSFYGDGLQLFSCSLGDNAKAILSMTVKQVGGDTIRVTLPLGQIRSGGTWLAATHTTISTVPATKSGTITRLDNLKPGRDYTAGVVEHLSMIWDEEIANGSLIVTLNGVVITPFDLVASKHKATITSSTVSVNYNGKKYHAELLEVVIPPTSLTAIGHVMPKPGCNLQENGVVAIVEGRTLGYNSGKPFDPSWMQSKQPHGQRSHLRLIVRMDDSWWKDGLVKLDVDKSTHYKWDAGVKGQLKPKVLALYGSMMGRYTAQKEILVKAFNAAQSTATTTLTKTKPAIINTLVAGTKTATKTITPVRTITKKTTRTCPTCKGKGKL